MVLKGQLGLWSSGTIVGIFCLFGFIAPLVDYSAQDAVNQRERQFCPPAFVDATPEQSRSCPKPTGSFFGTDHLGREVGIRLFKGIQAVFFPGCLAAILAIFIGGLLGAVGGYTQGALRAITLGLIRIIDTLPRMVFLILVCTIFRPSITLIAVVAGILSIPTVATVVRVKVERLASEDYILAHIAHGFRPVKILLYHILWLQCRSVLIRQASFIFGYIVFIEAALCYLGDYGVQEPQPSWGNMIAQAKSYALMSTWPWLFPSLAVMVTIAAFMAFGNVIANRDEGAKR
ncbi:MAG: ABC transporter permease [Myxococcota bacterium]|nr:ABC transporter permease [Myxococcota bacterium]